MSITLPQKKFEDVVLFLLSRALGQRLGVTKLWKLVYYVDVMHVEQFGRAVTGVRFIKDRHGPVPAEGLALVERLGERRAASLEKARRFRHYQHLCRAMVPPDLRDFEFSERAVLEEVALEWMQATTKQLELAIRESQPWKAARYGDQLLIVGRSGAA